MQLLDRRQKMAIEYLLGKVSEDTFIQVLELHIAAGFDILARPSDYTTYEQGSMIPAEVLFGSVYN